MAFYIISIWNTYQVVFKESSKKKIKRFYCPSHHTYYKDFSQMCTEQEQYDQLLLRGKSFMSFPKTQIDQVFLPATIAYLNTNFMDSSLTIQDVQTIYVYISYSVAKHASLGQIMSDWWHGITGSKKEREPDTEMKKVN